MPEKAPAASAGAFQFVWRSGKSVARRERCAEAAKPVIDPSGDHIHVGSGVGGDRSDGGRQRGRQERLAIVHPPKVVVLDADRPIRGEAVFKAGTDRATPACPVCRNNAEPSDAIEQSPLPFGDRCAALHVPENVVPGVTNLPREKTQRIYLRGPRVTREEQAGIRVSDVGPITLGFETE